MTHDRNALIKDASRLWLRVRRGETLAAEERELMRTAYWEGALPKDQDYSVAQWVEDGCPAITTRD